MRFNEVESTSQNQMDFVPRDQRSQMRNLISAFVCAMVLVILAGYLPGPHYHKFTPIISVAVIGLLCFYVVFRRQQNIDQVMATEYQNLLFAQAVSLGTSFCMFARRDGTIVYANDGVRSLFPYFTYSDSQLLDAIFEAGHVPRVDRERLLIALQSGATDRLVFPVQLHTGEKKEYVLTVEPLARPSGFSVIRGREYLGQRSGTQLLPDVLRATSADKLDHMLTHTPVAHFTTDPYGRFEYVNPSLEKLLGYAPNEILEKKLSIQSILFQLAGRSVADDYTPADYSGDAVFQQSQGAHMAGMLFQRVLRDSAGKTAGLTGSIVPVGGAAHVGA